MPNELYGTHEEFHFHCTAVLFDMDGVIIDTHHAVTTFWHELAEAHKLELTAADFAAHIYGCPATHTLRMLFTDVCVDEYQKVLDDMVEYESNLTYRAIPGAIDLLHALQLYRIPTALVTSGNNRKVEEVCRQLDLADLFTSQVTSDDIVCGKPEPECYVLAAENLGTTPYTCLVFEDAISGVQAATAAGAMCIGVEQSTSVDSALLAEGAWTTISDLTVVSLSTPDPSCSQEDVVAQMQIGDETQVWITSGRRT